jgi:hypothetical protein
MLVVRLLLQMLVVRLLQMLVVRLLQMLVVMPVASLSFNNEHS